MWAIAIGRQFHVGKGRIGYREMQSRKLVPVEKCPIGSPRINEAIARLNRMVRDRRWPGFLESIEIFTDERQVQWNVLETRQPIAKQFFDWLALEMPGTVPGSLDYAVGEDIFTVGVAVFLPE